jgi:hypothetical protein
MTRGCEWEVTPRLTKWPDPEEIRNFSHKELVIEVENSTIFAKY